MSNPLAGRGYTTRNRLRRHGVGWLAYWVLVLSLLGLTGPGEAAPLAVPCAAPHVAEAGLPLIRNFNPAEYGAGAQNWAIAQDRQGVIYVGNNDDGVLVFDGSSWQRIAIPNLGAVRALAADRDGRIYVGAVGELGYLAPDASGRMRYVSLLDRIPKGDRGFSNVWQVFPTDDGVYFSTFTHLFRLRGSQMAVWKPGTSFHFAFLVAGTLYIREVDRGLMRVQGDRLEPVAGGERFAKEKVYALLPWGKSSGKPGDLLIGTRTQGWFVFDGSSYRPWATEADAALKQDLLYGATWLADGTLAVTTMQGGVSLLDENGRLLRHLTKASGLTDNAVYALFQDRQRGLWLALNSGIARIDLGSPITQFDDRTGLHGTVYAMQRHAGRMYVGTSQGLFRLGVDAESSARFEQVAQVPGQTWALLDLGGSMLVATNMGVFEIVDDRVSRILDPEQTTESLLQSRRDPARVYVGMQNGIEVLSRDKDRWVDEGRIPEISDEVATLFEQSDGRVWLGNWNGGAIRLTPAPGGVGGSAAYRVLRVDRFGTRDGLPVGFNPVFPMDSNPRFAGTSGGIFQFDERHTRFVPDPRFAGLFPEGSRAQWPLFEDADGRVWMATSDPSSGFKEAGAAIRDAHGIYRWSPTPLQPISGNYIQAIHGDRDGVIWFGGHNGVFRYDPGRHVVGDPQFTALLRAVTGRDGHPVVGRTERRAKLELTFANNALRFAFAAPSYDTLEANRFQVLLEGLDRNWSAWSSESYRDYPSLPEGEYRFHVRARNVYGVVGAEASYAFRILPPWYRTWWARISFLAFLIAALSLIVWGLFWTRLQIVTARLAVLTERNRMAREIHDTLAQGFAGVSIHLESVEEMLRTQPDTAEHHLSHARNLVRRCIGQARSSVLDLHQHDPQDRDLSADMLKEGHQATAGTAIEVEMQSSGSQPDVSADVAWNLLQIVREALSNAVKHARANRIRIVVAFAKRTIEVRVEDDGRGFDIGSNTHGSGFGMVSMRERAQMIRATLEVRSAPGQGTTVRIVVPVR